MVCHVAPLATPIKISKLKSKLIGDDFWNKEPAPEPTPQVT
jgi:hypothetical protein